MPTRKPWRKGDPVEITYEGHLSRGVVLMASENGRSLALALEGVLGGYVGNMPVLREEGSGAYYDLITGCRVWLRRLHSGGAAGEVEP